MKSLILSAHYNEGTGHIRDHYHDCNELIYLVGGRATVCVGNARYAATAGTLVLISRFERHSVQADGEDYARYTLQLSPNVYGYGAFPGQKLLSVLVNRPENFCHALHMPGCTALMDRILQEIRGQSPMKNKMLDLLLFELLVLLCRAHPQLLAPDGGNLGTILQVQQYLEEGMSRRITMQELSERFHLSSSYLSHLFKQVTGHSVMGYLMACRIAAAKRLLAETHMPIGSILDACGFTDSSNFSRTFRQHTGLSPTAFREKYRSDHPLT